jgi:hypothetical protein
MSLGGEIMKKYNLKKAVILPTILAVGILPNVGGLTAYASTLSNNTPAVQNTSSTTGVKSEVLAGTDENWTKLKVTDENGTVEYIERVVSGDTQTYKVYSDTYKQTGEVVSDGKSIKVNGKAVQINNNQKVSSNVTQLAGTGTVVPNVSIGDDGMYLVDVTNSSFAADFNTVATCISFLSVLFNILTSWVTTAASAIMSANIPTVWYTSRLYSDKAPYHPTYEKYITYYSNSSRTKILSVSDAIY